MRTLPLHTHAIRVVWHASVPVRDRVGVASPCVAALEQKGCILKKNTAFLLGSLLYTLLLTRPITLLLVDCTCVPCRPSHVHPTTDIGQAILIKGAVPIPPNSKAAAGKNGPEKKKAKKSARKAAAAAATVGTAPDWFGCPGASVGRVIAADVAMAADTWCVERSRPPGATMTPAVGTPSSLFLWCQFRI